MQLGLAHQIAGTHDDGLGATQRHARAFQKAHHAQRGAGHQLRRPGHQCTGIGHVKAVDVLVGRDGLDHAARADVGRQGKLHQDAVHGRILVQFIQPGQQGGLGGLLGQVLADRMEACGLAGADLVAYIDLGSRRITHQDHGQAGALPRGIQNLLGSLAHFFAHLGGDGSAINQSSSHGWSPVRQGKDGQGKTESYPKACLGP